MYGPHGQLSSVYSISASVMCKFYFKIHILLPLLYHPERHDYDVAKMGFKTGAGKT
jgi:hypothetical protein